ncbi:hypothetical protein PM082_007429 [Marasmius tenuissimus]|nr:hypothetical protein PM082_007429 [Marasmius tenuissimus]
MASPSQKPNLRRRVLQLDGSSMTSLLSMPGLDLDIPSLSSPVGLASSPPPSTIAFPTSSSSPAVEGDALDFSTSSSSPPSASTFTIRDQKRTLLSLSLYASKESGLTSTRHQHIYHSVRHHAACTIQVSFHRPKTRIAQTHLPSNIRSRKASTCTAEFAEFSPRHVHQHRTSGPSRMLWRTTGSQDDVGIREESSPAWRFSYKSQWPSSYQMNIEL